MMAEAQTQYTILNLFREFLRQNIAVPVAAMNALVEAIKVGYVEPVHFCFPFFPSNMALYGLLGLKSYHVDGT
ncbi:hypothetical protein EON65_19640 [archaeon]|nr:MAG: hypothetical protein EON65_19640 [archaeon]